MDLVLGGKEEQQKGGEITTTHSTLASRIKLFVSTSHIQLFASHANSIVTNTTSRRIVFML